MPVDPVRDAAVDVLLRVFEKGAFLNVALDRTLRRKTELSRRGTRFLTQLVYGTVRHKILCEHIVRPLLRQPFEKLPPPIQTILRMSVFQALFCANVPAHAMVHTAVDLAKKRGHAGTARLVNAVLKRIPQRIEDVKLPNRDEGPVPFLSTRYSIAPWIAESWLAEYGWEGALALCQAADEEAPQTLRVNTARTTPEQLIAILAKSEIAATPHPIVPNMLDVSDGGALATTKAFQQGLCYIQDPASTLPVHLLDPQPADCILDMCASPGGKTTLIAERLKGSGLAVAMDVLPKKLRFVHENLERLGLERVACVASNGTSPPFRDGTFDRVLCDAPCSALGTLRRHPELKWRLSREAPRECAKLQERLLRRAIALCQNGGLAVYSVCTFTPEETGGVVEDILRGGAVLPEDGPEWMEQWKIGTGRYRILPKTSQLDGYFLMRFRKVS